MVKYNEPQAPGDDLVAYPTGDEPAEAATYLALLSSDERIPEGLHGQIERIGFDRWNESQDRATYE
jgi:hypothetical protein